jgi:hypothetical protein
MPEITVRMERQLDPAINPEEGMINLIFKKEISEYDDETIVFTFTNLADFKQFRDAVEEMYGCAHGMGSAETKLVDLNEKTGIVN